MKSKYYDLIVAWAGGAVIQYRRPGEPWETAGAPGADNQPGWFEEDCEYRLKPAPVVRWCGLAQLGGGALVLGGGRTEKRYAGNDLNLMAASDNLVGVVRIELDPETFDVISAFTEKP